MTNPEAAGDEPQPPPASPQTLGELKRRRAEIAASLAELDRKRTATVQTNSYARARERAGVTEENAEAMSRLQADEGDAHAAIRAARMELYRLDAEIEGRPRPKGIGAVLRRLRGGEG